MALADWSRSYFSYNGGTPTYLPELFRLPSGLTRNSNNCELSDILLAGYTGPFPDPPAPGDDSVVSWDSSSDTWVITEISDLPDYSAYLKSKETCSHIRSLLDGCPVGLENPDITESYRQSVFAYYGELFYLLHCCEHHGHNITESDLPDLPDDSFSTVQKVQERQNVWLNENYTESKNYYETQGLIPGDFSLSNLQIPSDWVLGRGPINPVTMFKPYFLPPGYEISIPVVASSGYYMLVPSGSDISVPVPGYSGYYMLVPSGADEVGN